MRGVPNFFFAVFWSISHLFRRIPSLKVSEGKTREFCIPLHKGKKLRVSQLISKRTKTQRILFYKASPNP
ncbi:hypothetical protein DLM75_07210 [Leptospira stimsonii]|uniref:Uncharacterized protein n=1 Tax=Leptospira stimsonii TaxID=2202203 RepID=A0A396ZBF8_9LEPT|nr:hypothetical protein DLM75_07210 [Leptospira stimsonii]